MSHLITVINENQHGFVPGKRIETNLLELVLFAYDAFAEKCQVDVLYTDFTKAFDRVDHAILIKKMKKLTFDPGFIKWIASYLDGRLMKVKINNSFSNTYTMQIGAPAGSVLGTVLFLIYINDLPSIFENYCKVLLYADDCKLAMKIKNEDDARKFQAEIDKLDNWCIKNKLELNISKCAVLNINRTKNKIEKTYKLNVHNIKRESEFRDLGIIIDEKLTFKKHIETLIPACNSRLGFIKRTAGQNFDTETLVLLYNTYVNPIRPN